MRLRKLSTFTLTDLVLVVGLGTWGWWALGWWEGGAVLAGVMLYVVGAQVEKKGA